MSTETVIWALDVIRTKRWDLRPGAKVVLLTLAECHDPEGGCYPTREALGEKCGMSPEVVLNHIRELEAARVIRRYARFWPGTKRQAPNGFKLACEPDFDPGCYA